MILIWRFVGSVGDGEHVATACLFPRGQGRHRSVVPEGRSETGGAQDAVREAPRGEASTAGHVGERIPMETGEEGRIQFGSQPNMISETHMAPESGEQPPLKEGGVHRFHRWPLSIQGRRIT